MVIELVGVLGHTYAKMQLLVIERQLTTQLGDNMNCTWHLSFRYSGIHESFYSLFGRFNRLRVRVSEAG